jgi:two-component system response regulator YesN
MNILLIDDDEMITTTMKSMISWEKLEIDSVYSASSSVVAKKIIESVMIDILVCDIEMPGLSGLELVEWVRQEGSDAQVIFLTSYAEFSYAQQAIKLQGQEYLLKPISYEKLNKTLETAVWECKRKMKLKQQQNFWNEKPAMRNSLLWRWVCIENNKLKKEDIKKLSDTLEYKTDDRFIYIRMEIYDYYTIYEKLESGMFAFVLTNITHELFEDEFIGVETVFRTDSEDASQWNLIFKVRKAAEIKEHLRSTCRKYIMQIAQSMNSSVGCFISESRGFEGIGEEIARVIQVSQEVVLGKEKICFIDEVISGKAEYVEPEFKQWEKLILIGDKDRVFWIINRYLDSLASSMEVNRRAYTKFFEDFRQMLYGVLKERDIAISRCAWLQDYQLCQSAMKSVDNMKTYTSRSISEVVEIMQMQTGKKTPVDQIKDYIRNHMHEELTRETFSEMLFINPDYLAKLFKKETGISLGNYLTEQRVDKAKELLSCTDEMINTVSVKVGYSSFSYFSKVFREYTGMAPNEFRKKYRK